MTSFISGSEKLPSSRMSRIFFAPPVVRPEKRGTILEPLLNARKNLPSVSGGGEVLRICSAPIQNGMPKTLLVVVCKSHLSGHNTKDNLKEVNHLHLVKITYSIYSEAREMSLMGCMGPCPRTHLGEVLNVVGYCICCVMLGAIFAVLCIISPDFRRGFVTMRSA